MKFAVIENGKVENIVLADEDFAASQGWVPCDHADIGWSYENGQFVEPTPDSEAEAKQMRAMRDSKLSASDIAVLPDRWAAMTSEQQAAWATYRQALRDIPTQAGFPWDIAWPEKPTA